MKLPWLSARSRSSRRAIRLGRGRLACHLFLGAPFSFGLSSTPLNPFLQSETSCFCVFPSASKPCSSSGRCDDFSSRAFLTGRFRSEVHATSVLGRMLGEHRLAEHKYDAMQSRMFIVQAHGIIFVFSVLVRRRAQSVSAMNKATQVAIKFLAKRP